MSKFKKLSSLILSLMLVLTISACSEEKAEETKPEASVPEKQEEKVEEQSKYPFPEQDTYEIVLTAFTDKIKTIKLIREVVTGMSLKDAKAIVDTVPQTIKKDVPNQEAKGIYDRFIELGASIEMK